MLTDQDLKIIRVVITSDFPMTAYAIARKTNISTPQVQYRLDKLVESTVVSPINAKNRTSYCIHPVLQANDAITEISTHLNQIAVIIDEMQFTPIEGMTQILNFLIEHLREEPEETTNH